MHFDGFVGEKLMNFTAPATQPIGLKSRSAFTLVEIMVVVVIIGLLATLATASISKVKEKSVNAGVASDLRTFASAFDQYALETGVWPVDAHAGVVPVEMAGRISTSAWSKPTPGNGRWDWENGGIGIRAGISMYGSNLNDADLAKIDAVIDDGNVNTGKFRRIHDGRPTFVLEE